VNSAKFSDGCHNMLDIFPNGVIKTIEAVGICYIVGNCYFAGSVSVFELAMFQPQIDWLTV